MVDFQQDFQDFTLTPILTMNLYKRIVLFFGLSVVISSATAATANLLGGYVVSDNPKPIEQRRSLSSGSRSNCQSRLNKGDIELAVPQQEVVHVTTKDRPSLYLISRKENIPFKFTLVEPSSTKILTEKELTIEEKGLQKIDIDKELNLSEGKTYLWYVAFPCQNNPEEYYDVLGAGIEKRSLTPQVQSALDGAENEAEKAAVFANSGFWYEALESAIENPNTDNERLQKLFKSAGIEYQNNAYSRNAVK